jgi:uncharacterized protein YjeT (DUF2065 family)
MKQLLKRSGIIIIVLGVLILGISELTKQENNQLLLISGILIMSGFVIYLIINNILE